MESQSNSGKWLAAGLGLAAAGYATYASLAWSRYGSPSPSRPEEQDDVLDRFMPHFEVVERHHTNVAAPAETTFEAAKEMELSSSPVVRAIFKGRELIFGTIPNERRQPKGIVAEMLSLGWGVLAETPGREIVLGAVTKPWEPNVTFRPIAPDSFAAFGEPGYVKIAWTLRADPVASNTSIFRTETRAVATDEYARAKFRLYWSFVSPGIWLIRRMLLGPVKADAERRYRGGASAAPVSAG